MFDCDNKYSFPILVDKILKYDIYYHCCFCGTRIQTRWSKNKKITGNFHCFKQTYCEIFGYNVCMPRYIVCEDCYKELGSGRIKNILSRR